MRTLWAAAALLLAGGCDDGAEASGTLGDAAVDAAAVGASAPDSSAGPDLGPGPFSRELAPTQSEAFYVAQAEIYFDTLDTRADPEVVPMYAELVARWEWPPWLYLTGYGAEQMVNTTRSALELDPSTVTDRDCRFFPVQPFARCYVVFQYDEGPCPIYEEFTFNDAGEMTFIEAWSDLPELLPLAEGDRWGEAPDVPRLSTRVPGLGRPDGRIDLMSDEMAATAAVDPQVADFVRRASDFWLAWAEALGQAGSDLYARGCGW